MHPIFRFLYLVALASLLPLGAWAQSCAPQRYFHRIFGVNTTRDIVFGNAPALTTVYVAENVTVPEDLKLDLFEPAGDTLAKRPLVLFAFGGGFLVGSKEDADIQGVCDTLAGKGYVAAAINYRLGLNAADAGSAERAVWRGAQDYSAAIRFFKEYADSFRIDTNYIFAGGVSAGSFSLLHSQYATDAQRPASTYASSFPIAPDLGCKDCSGNAFAHSSAVRAAINCWGAIGDTNWIDALDSVPLLSFHGDLDPIVPYGYGFPFTAILTLPRVYGSSLIAPRMDHLGLPQSFVPFPGEGHNIWGTVALNAWAPGSPTAFWEPILQRIRDYLYPHVAPIAPLPFGPNMVNQGDIETYIVPPTVGSQYCWSVTGGNILGPSTGPSISVQWTNMGAQILKVQEINHLDAVSEADSMAIVVGPVGVVDAINGGRLEVFPNPIEAGKPLQFGLTGAKGTLKATVYDVMGHITTTWEGSWNDRQQCELHLPPVTSAGQYWLVVETGNNRFIRPIQIIRGPR